MNLITRNQENIPSSLSLYKNRTVFFHLTNQFLSAELLNQSFALVPALHGLTAISVDTAPFGELHITAVEFQLTVSEDEINPFRRRIDKIKAIVAEYLPKCSLETKHTCTVMHRKGESIHEPSLNLRLKKDPALYNLVVMKVESQLIGADQASIIHFNLVSPIQEHNPFESRLELLRKVIQKSGVTRNQELEVETGVHDQYASMENPVSTTMPPPLQRTEPFSSTPFSITNHLDWLVPLSSAVSSTSTTLERTDSSTFMNVDTDEPPAKYRKF